MSGLVLSLNCMICLMSNMMLYLALSVGMLAWGEWTHQRTTGNPFTWSQRVIHFLLWPIMVLQALYMILFNQNEDE